PGTSACACLLNMSLASIVHSSVDVCRSLSLLFLLFFFFFNATATTEFYTLSLHDALPISICTIAVKVFSASSSLPCASCAWAMRSEEHTSELQSRGHLVCRLLLEKKKNGGPRGQRPCDRRMAE